MCSAWGWRHSSKVSQTQKGHLRLTETRGISNISLVLIHHLLAQLTAGLLLIHVLAIANTGMISQV